MDRTYEEEIATLGATWRAWQRWRGEAELGALTGRLGGPAAFVASGGSLAVAHLAAAAYERRWRQPAAVLTPVEFALSPVEFGTVVVISDSMSHPDALLAADLAAAGRACAVVLSNRTAEELRDRLTDRLAIVSAPRPGRDGWIATNSVLSLSLGALTLLGADEGAPDPDEVVARWVVGGLLRADADTTRPRLLCLYTPGLRNVAVDLETRVMEAGLGSVTISDLRNLGHGRHVGLYRNAGSTSVLVLAERRWTPLVRGTVDSLPPAVEATVWQAGCDDAWAPVELLVPSAAFLASRAAEAGVDPGNPEVWPGGNALFRTRVADVVPDVLGERG
ncbi:hypothetical protein AB0B12_29745 [Streptomyces sp. NPDC044780]|uniref:hypothetical protein n=1 Tax=unclassified Streptomyces TaxID=2593676 RepID=UPI0033D55548